MQRFLLAVSTPLLVLMLAAFDGVPTAAAYSPLAAQDSEATSIQVKVSSMHRTYACQNSGDSVQVTGSNDVLTITGTCGSLQVTGNQNIIVIDAVQTVQFTGHNNSVIYRSSHRPTVGDNGQSNSIARGTGEAAAAHSNSASGSHSASSDNDTAVSSNSNDSVGNIVSNALQAANAASQAAASTAGSVQGIQNNGNTLNIILSRQKTTQDCGDGKMVNINGYENDITLTGSCQKVVLNGWGNTIAIEEVGAIEVSGHNNIFNWERARNARKPVVQIDNGMDNSVRHVTQISK
jgi:hypothetical protein